MNLVSVQANIEQHLSALAKFTATPGIGVTRFPYTDEAKAALDYLRKEMESAGLKVYLDNSGSLIGRLEGEEPETIMFGSHYDSVRNGGAYDGIAGVVCAIETARALIEEKVKLYYSLEIIATNDEEGARFHAGLFTGKALFGQYSPTQLKEYLDADGISIYQAMKNFGLQPEAINAHPRKDLKAFLEIHIEQGPVLEAEGKQLGIVDVIVGIKRVLVTIHGQADHSGTMPMHMRKDAMDFAAKVISKIGDRARQYPGAVATVGFMQVEPNVMNIIARQVSFTVDIRAVDSQALIEQRQALQADLEGLAEDMGMSFELEDLLDEQPVMMHDVLKASLQEQCHKQLLSYMHLPSGAGHDAQIFGEQIPAAMLFVPSRGGRSHCPEEWSDGYDLAVATNVLHDALIALQNKEL